MADKSAAKSQYDDYIRSLGGNPNADTEGDFENLWNQSAEAGLYAGAGYGKSWDDNFANFQPTLSQRWTRPTASNGGAGGDIDPYGLGKPKSAAQSWSGNIQQQPL